MCVLRGSSPLVWLKDRLPCQASPWGHPTRGKRIGEASKPGPPTEEASLACSASGVANSAPSTPQGRAEINELFAGFNASGSQATPPTLLAPQAMSNPAPSSQRSSRRRRPQPTDHSVVGTSDLPIQLTLRTGKPVTLQCHWMHKNHAWRWSLTAGRQQLLHESVKGPKPALREWLHKFKHLLTPLAEAEVLSALAMYPDSLPQASAPTPVSALAQATQTAPASVQAASVQVENSQPSRPRENVAPALFPRPPRHPVQDTLLDTPTPSELSPAAYTVPLHDQIAPWVRMSAHDFLQLHIPTIRVCPKSCEAIVTNAVAWLASLYQDPLQSAPLRQTAIFMLLTLPKWLLPLPPRNAQGHLPPHARPNMVKSRTKLLFAGPCLELHRLLHCPLHTQGANPLPHAQGVVTSREAQAITRAAQQGKLTTAWKRLNSHGILPLGRDALALVKPKWNPDSSVMPPVDMEPLQHNDAATLVTDRTCANPWQDFV